MRIPSIRKFRKLKTDITRELAIWIKKKNSLGSGSGMLFLIRSPFCDDSSTSDSDLGERSKLDKVVTNLVSR